MDEKMKCCGSDSSCCPAPDQQNMSLRIEFMYIDLTTCDRCLGTDMSLAEAIAEVGEILRVVGYEIEIHKILVTSEAQADELGFVSSPTIRINGVDIQMEVKESLCEACCDIGGTEVDCRMWSWRGREYSVPPKAMIIDAVLRHVYGGQRFSQPVKRAVPDNLKRFFSEKDRCK